MKQRALVYSGQVELVEYPVVPIHENILVKPLYVYLGDIEHALINGNIPLVKPVVLGSTGVVKVVEVFNGPTEYTGKMYTVAPLGDRGILGVDINGLLSSYTTLTHPYLDEELTQFNPYDSLRPLAKHASEIALICEEPVLIEGCGLIGISVGLLLRKMGIEPVFYCEEGVRRALVFEFNVHKHTGSLSTKWRTMVFTSTSMSTKYTLLLTTEQYHVVITPLSFTRWLPIPPSKRGSIKVTMAWKMDNYNIEHVRSILRDLGKVIKIYEIQDVEKVIGLIPPRGLGVIVLLKG